MNRMIFKHELQTRIRSILTWGLSITALVFVLFTYFSVFAKEAELMQALLAKFPKELLIAFGMEHINYSTPLGYLAFFFLFIQLCLAIQACNFGVGLVSIEETELTADFLLTKPVSRMEILSSKVGAALASLVLTDAIVWVSVFFALTIYGEGKPYDPRTLVLLLASLLFMQFFFFGVGLMISLLVKRVRSVTPYSLALAFGAYVLNAFSGVFGDVKLEYITPFKHFEPGYIVDHAAYNTPLLVFNVTITLLSLAASYWLYLHRDISAVS